MDSKQIKLEKAAKMLEKSPASNMNFVFSEAEWAGILSDLDEEKLDELLLILNEEHSMRKDVEKEQLRKKETNKARYLQRLENLKVRAESLQYKSPNNG